MELTDAKDHIDSLKQIIETIIEIEPRYKKINEEVANVDLLLNDFIHDIENSNFNACEGYLKAKKLKELRQYRRKLKNEVYILTKLHDWYLRNKNLEIELFKIKVQMEKTKEQQENWTYKKRSKEGVGCPD